MNWRSVFAAVGVVAAAIVALLLVAAVPEILPPSVDELTPAEQSSETGQRRTAALALLAGILATIGAVYTHRNYKLAGEARDRDREGQITERYGRAVEQLGHQEDDVRVGGIYSLRRIADESARDRDAISAVLCAYLKRRGRVASASIDAGMQLVAEDVDAALSVLGHLATTYSVVPDLSRAVLAPLDFTRASLPGARFNASYLDRAAMAYGRFDGAVLVEANLEHADLRRVNVEGANFSRAHAANVNLSHAKAAEADFCETSLSGANLLYLHARGATFCGSNLTGAHLNGADLRDADFTDAVFDSDTNFSGANTQGAVFDRANVEDAKGLERPEA